MPDNQNDFNTHGSKGLAGVQGNVIKFEKPVPRKKGKIDTRDSMGLAGENESPKKEGQPDFLPDKQ